jgi:hypothetical protein
MLTLRLSSIAVFAKEKQLRKDADRRADDAMRDGRKARQQYLETVWSAQNTQQRFLETSQRLEAAESSLRGIRIAVQDYVAGDERQLRARRSAVQH